MTRVYGRNLPSENDDFGTYRPSWRGAARVWGNECPVLCWFPILAHAWWIGIASGGTFMSAFFVLTRLALRSSINPLAETMTLFAAAPAGVYLILQLGRPYLGYSMFPNPNTMALGRSGKTCCVGTSWRY